MPTLKMSEDKILTITKAGNTYEDENNAEIIKILLPHQINGNDLNDCVIHLCVLNQGNLGDEINISSNLQQYCDELYVANVDVTNKITYNAGDIQFWINILNSDNKMVAKTNPVIYQVKKHLDIEDYIPEQNLSLLDDFSIRMEQSFDDIENALKTVDNIKEKADSGEFEGKSAYEIAIQNGFKGAEEEWLESLRGEDGYTPVKGKDYYTEADKEAIVRVVSEDLSDDGYIKNTDYATKEVAGVVKVDADSGIRLADNKTLMVVSADKDDIDNKSSALKVITPNMLDYAVKSITYDKKKIDNTYATIEELSKATKWKMLIDTTLTEEQGGVKSIKLEITEDISQMQEFNFYIEFPITEENKDTSLYVSAYINGTLSGNNSFFHTYTSAKGVSGKTYCAMSNSKVINVSGRKEILTFHSMIGDKTVVGNGTRGYAVSAHAPWVIPQDTPLYLNVGTSTTTFLSGTKIFLEGR